MLPLPDSLEAFDREIPDEPAAERVLVAIRWPTGVCCPECGSFAMTRLTTRALAVRRLPQPDLGPLRHGAPRHGRGAAHALDERVVRLRLDEVETGDPDPIEPGRTAPG